MKISAKSLFSGEDAYLSELLRVTGLMKVFKLHLLGGREVTACRDIEFTLYPGEVLGIQGPSGTGKSTILKCLYRTCLATAGQAWYRSLEGSVDLLHAPVQTILALRRLEIGYVSQFLRVVPRVSALQVVAEGLLRQGWTQSQALREAARLLDHLKIPADLWEASPCTFSGGEQQRVNIARAVAGWPRLLLMDEPTASLDQESKRPVQGLILELKRRGTSIVVVSHDRQTFNQITDRVLRLNQGSKTCVTGGTKHVAAVADH